MTDKTPESDDQERIVVDDDWKAQVEQEKESLKEQMDAHVGEQDQEMPPASLPMLVNTLAMQALASLGQIPDPVEGKAVVRKSVAKHFIDTLAVIDEKTQGNLTDDEKEMLSGTLHQLRMVLVSTPDSGPDDQNDEPAKSSSIELP